MVPAVRGDGGEGVVHLHDWSGSVLRTAVLTEGATDRSLIPVRDVLALVLATGGTSFGVAHNHPMACTDPSEADRRATTRLAEGTATVGLRFLDRVVATDRGWRVPPE